MEDNIGNCSECGEELVIFNGFVRCQRCGLILNQIDDFKLNTSVTSGNIFIKNASDILEEKKRHVINQFTLFNEKGSIKFSDETLNIASDIFYELLDKNQNKRGKKEKQIMAASIYLASKKTLELRQPSEYIEFVGLRKLGIAYGLTFLRQKIPGKIEEFDRIDEMEAQLGSISKREEYDVDIYKFAKKIIKIIEINNRIDWGKSIERSKVISIFAKIHSLIGDFNIDEYCSKHHIGKPSVRTFISIMDIHKELFNDVYEEIKIYKDSL